MFAGGGSEAQKENVHCLAPSNIFQKKEDVVIRSACAYSDTYIILKPGHA